jgi:hypothetical protein
MRRAMTRLAEIVRSGPASDPIDERLPRARPVVRYTVLAAVFLCAFGVRYLYATDAIARLYGVEQERYRIAHFYHEAAASLAEGDDRVAFPRGLAPEDTLLVGYPPGYFLFMAPIYAAASDGMAAVVVVQCLVDALACVLLVLVGEAIVSTFAGAVAGLLMALSPQFAYLSVVLKPDTLTVVPVLVAVLFVVRGLHRDDLRSWLVAGLSLGVACWLRQNALLLAPALAVAGVVAGGRRVLLKRAAAMVAVCAALVAPLTIRNLVIYGDPIPVTIGSGFALLSGLARDDYAGRYGLSRFAYNVSVDEAHERGLPDAYYFDEYDVLQAGHDRKYETKHTVLSVFAVDGIARDRERRRASVRLIASDPVYFASIYWLRIERLLGYTQQNRPVPLEPTPAEHAYESLAFYRAVEPDGGLSRYYVDRSSLWDFARPAVASVQALFTTPLLLGVAALGLLLCAVRSWRRTVLLLVLPAYYLGLQALMWAEFRHTLPVHVSIFILIGVTCHSAAWAARGLLPGRAR